MVELDRLDLPPMRYPGRGLAVGLAPDGRSIIQVYWVTGRSATSRNRVLAMDGDDVVTTWRETPPAVDPALFIYPAMLADGSRHLVSNGTQTRDVREHLRRGGSFSEALEQLTFEPDAQRTPRIVGMFDGHAEPALAWLGKVVPSAGSGDDTLRATYTFQPTRPGTGLCLQTYEGDIAHVQPYARDPYAVPLLATANETAGRYWAWLAADLRVGLAVKQIDLATGDSLVVLKNID